VKAFLIVIALAASAAAEAATPREAVMIYAADLIDETGCYGIAYRHLWSPRIAMQISYGTERHDLGGGFFGLIIGNPGPRVRVHTNPIDVEGQYQFVNSTRFQPFIGVGARHVSGPQGRRDRTSPEFTGGLLFVVSPHFGVLLSGKQLLRSDTPDWDPWLRIDAGLAFRF